ncbi:5-hydroxytryptamine receptor [Melipona quadrifasciata]|uniref:5-hydroxytryptamine receptor n=1 Tax=Melipona quadrifasciata TaxID=166423 RepID=A0A0N0BCX6_9HYME|nr:5-hydroxytryptamine receptor [Melipona quadrifasciata]
MLCEWSGKGVKGNGRTDGLGCCASDSLVHSQISGTQPRLQYKHSHDLDPGYSIGRAMRQSSKKASHGPDHRYHVGLPATRLVGTRILAVLPHSALFAATSEIGRTSTLGAQPLAACAQSSVRNPKVRMLDGQMNFGAVRKRERIERLCVFISESLPRVISGALIAATAYPRHLCRSYQLRLVNDAISSFGTQPRLQYKHSHDLDPGYSIGRAMRQSSKKASHGPDHRYHVGINSGWSLGPELCDMWTSSDVLCCTASILHLVAIAVDRYWAVTDLNYIQARNPRRIGMLIVTVWVVSLGISLAPQLGWKDPHYLERIADGTCLVSQDPAYQKQPIRLSDYRQSSTGYFYLNVGPPNHSTESQRGDSPFSQKPRAKRPRTLGRHPARVITNVINYKYSHRIFLKAEKKGRKQHEPPPDRNLAPREESTAFTITRSTPDHSSISPEKSSSYNGANATQSTTVTPSAVSTTTTTTTTTVTNPSCSHSTTSSSKRTRETIESKRERKAAKTLAIITGAFVACWLPFFLVALLRATCEACEPPELMASVFLWLGYFNSTLNPVIYTVFSPEFRQAFKRMLCGGSRIIR